MAMPQRFVIKILKVIFLISTLSFVIIQIHLRRNVAAVSGQEAPKSAAFVNELTKEAPAHENKVSADHSNSIVDHLDLNNYREPRGHFPSISKEPIFNPSTPRERNVTAEPRLPKPSLDDIRRSIEFNNLNTEILNADKFGDLSQLRSVIIVQVHNRSNYLDKLVKSLRSAKGIEDTLVIFSHDFYSPEINKIVRSIDFCRVMQIFYPYSIQIFPDRFPGQDPRDCPANIGRSKAEMVKCQNWQNPDKYGHYRVAKFTQIKHHWWWKMNYVFDGIAQLRSYDGYVLLLEEDHYVSPDFLHVMDYIVKNKEGLCKECSMISLGFYLKSYASYGSNIARLAVQPWFSSRHNMGMAFNRHTWNRLRNCSNLFCTFDDYNWDWSLMRVNMECLKPNKLVVIYAKAPRVFHIGDCGVHHKCQADSSAQKVAGILSGVKDQLYPPKLDVWERSKRMLRPPKENGGWGDLRDHYLCHNNTRYSL